MAYSIRVIGAELINHKREREVGASASAFFFGTCLLVISAWASCVCVCSTWDVAALMPPSGKLFSHVPLGILLPPALFLSTFYVLANPIAPFWKYYLYMTLPVQFCGSAIGFFASTAVRSSSAQFVGVVLVLLSAMFSGAYPTLSALGSMRFAAHASFIRYFTSLCCGHICPEVLHFYPLPSFPFHSNVLCVTTCSSPLSFFFE